MKWNSSLYDSKHGFVSEYGKELIAFIPDKDNQAILDLGCGTGTLTSQLTKNGNRVVGIDSSQDMIVKARAQFSDIEFLVCDILNLPFEHEFDIIFSNAVFHWIEDHDTLAKNIKKALKPKGHLICEFGAEGNIETIDQAFESAYSKHGLTYLPKFNFPSVHTFQNHLEANGLEITEIKAYDRPTILNDGTFGLENWIKQFYASELSILDLPTQKDILKEINIITKETLWDGTNWVADYRRLRAIAISS